jgi:threonine synthase
MYFISTRGTQRVTGAEAVVRGLADDGGLFVPEKFPQIGKEELERMLPMDYSERAAYVLHQYFDEYNYEGLKAACARAYAQFDDGDAAPLVKIKNGVYILELFHGPTCAFKDMALTVLPYLLREGCNICGIKEQILILVATSGDTGKAALEGFKDANGIKIMVFYPDEGVSKMQKLQMCTTGGNNTNVLAVRGNFDDCQTAVKRIFADEGYKAELKGKNTLLSSANSINFGRLAPQIAYYFSAYLDLLSSGQIEMGQKVDFTVPTGNFGNILAAYYAKQMGLPVGKLVCASNKNNILTDFINTGKYDCHRNFYKTMSPSMDILVSSNLERLLFEVSGRNATIIKSRMTGLNQDGVYAVTEAERKTIAESFFAGYANEEQTVESMYDFFIENGYPMDTHTGVAMRVAYLYMEKEKEEKLPKDKTPVPPMVVVSTASPYKFPQDVLYALTGNDVKDSFKGIKRLNLLTAMRVPKSLQELRYQEPRFRAVSDTKDLYKNVLHFLDVGTEGIVAESAPKKRASKKES